MKWGKAVNKIAIECWIRSGLQKENIDNERRKIWDEIGIFPVTEQRSADQARQTSGLQT